MFYASNAVKKSNDRNLSQKLFLFAFPPTHTWRYSSEKWRCPNVEEIFCRLSKPGHLNNAKRYPFPIFHICIYIPFRISTIFKKPQRYTNKSIIILLTQNPTVCSFHNFWIFATAINDKKPVDCEEKLLLLHSLACMHVYVWALEAASPSPWRVTCLHTTDYIEASPRHH